MLTFARQFNYFTVLLSFHKLLPNQFVLKLFLTQCRTEWKM